MILTRAKKKISIKLSNKVKNKTNKIGSYLENYRKKRSKKRRKMFSVLPQLGAMIKPKPVGFVNSHIISAFTNDVREIK